MRAGSQSFGASSPTERSTFPGWGARPRPLSVAKARGASLRQRNASGSAARGRSRASHGPTENPSALSSLGRPSKRERTSTPVVLQSTFSGAKGLPNEVAGHLQASSGPMSPQQGFLAPLGPHSQAGGPGTRLADKD